MTMLKMMKVKDDDEDFKDDDNDYVVRFLADSVEYISESTGLPQILASANAEWWIFIIKIIITMININFIIIIIIITNLQVDGCKGKSVQCECFLLEIRRPSLPPILE